MGRRLFVAANLCAIVLLCVFLVGARGGTRSGVVWLWPFAYGLAMIATFAVGAALPTIERRRLFLRHFLLYAFPFGAVAMIAGHPENRAFWWGLSYVALAIAIGGLLLGALWQSRATRDDQRMTRLLFLIALVVQLIIVPYRTLAIPPEADEPHYLIMADSIAFDNNINLRQNYEPARYAQFYPGRLPDVHAIEVGEELLPIRDLGLPLLAAGPFRLAGRPGVLILMAFIAAFLIAQTYGLLRDLGFTRGVKLAAVGIGAATNPLLTWATQIYPDLIVAAVVVTVARLLCGTGLKSVRHLAFAAMLTGTLPWLTTRAGFLALGLTLSLLVIAARRSGGWDNIRAGIRPVMTVAVAALTPLVALASLNWSLFQIPVPGAGFFLIRGQQDVLSWEPQLGAVGLIFDRFFGLVGLAPIYLLAFVGAGALTARTRNANAAALTTLIIGAVFHFAFIANLTHWHSDWAPASRNLVPVLPLLVVLVAAGIEAIARPRWAPAFRAIATATLCWSVILSLTIAARPQLAYELPDQLRATGATTKLWTLMRDIAGGVDVSRLLPSVVQESGSLVPLSIVWLAVALALVIAGRQASRRTIAV